MDVFPTVYALNAGSTIRRHFGRGADVVAYLFPPEPAYHFNNGLLYGMLRFVHKRLPDSLATNLLIFGRKQRREAIRPFGPEDERGACET